MWPQTPAGRRFLAYGTAHVAFGSSDSLGPCDFKDFVAQSHTPHDHWVPFAVGVTFHNATLVTRRALPLSRIGLSPTGPRQLRLAHRYSFTVMDLHHLLLAGLCRRTKNQDFCKTRIARTVRGLASARP